MVTRPKAKRIGEPASRAQPAKSDGVAVAERLPDRPLMKGYLPHYLSRVMNLLNLRLLDCLRPLNLTIQQFRVMQVLLARGVANVGEISRDTVIIQSVISRIVDQLEQRKFAVRRKRAGNARIVEVRLTPLGASVYRSISPWSQAIVEDAVSVLTREEKRLLEGLLVRIFHNVSNPGAPGLTGPGQRGPTGRRQRTDAARS